jgi:hypothetical protein
VRIDGVGATELLLFDRQRRSERRHDSRATSATHVPRDLWVVPWAHMEERAFGSVRARARPGGPPASVAQASAAAILLTSPRMTHCSRCGYAETPDATFCSRCAAPLGARPPAATPFAPSPPASPAPYSGLPQPNWHGSTAQPAQPAQKARSRLFVALPILLAGLAPLAFLGGGGCSGSVEGEIRSVGKPHGDFTLVPTSCFSGERESFFGVWVTPDVEEIDGHKGFRGGLKILKGHTNGWEVYVESPNECKGLECKIRQLAEESCETFEVEVRNTNTTINDVRVREGRAKLDCKTPEGGIFAAELEFSGCS